MHRKVTALWLLFVALAMAAACPFVLAGQSDAGSEQAGGPLWRLEKEGAVVYLLGSFHLLDNVDYRDNPALQNAFEDAETVVFETDIAELESSRTRRFVRSQGLYGKGKSLRGEISAETYRLLARTAGELGVPMKRLDTFRPWLCAITVTNLKYRQLGFRAQNGVDTYFYDRAERAGKEILALETPEEQISLFAALLPEDQEKLLARTLEDLDGFEQKVGRLVAAWKAGDAAALNRILLENFRDYPVIYRRLVTERNRRWLQQLEPLLGGPQEVLVVVGAAHLVGPEGLLRLLERRGYRVTQR